MANSVLESSALGLASAGAQQLFTDYNRDEDFRNYQKAQEQNYENSQNMQYNAPLMTKLGMAAAGLNPATMSNPSPASVPSAPLGSHVAPSVDLAQDNNLMADARLKNAEAEKTELQNDQLKGENESSFENYRKGLESLSNLYKEKGWNQMAESIDEEIGNISALKDEGKLQFNAGNLRGAVNAFTTLEAMQERLTNTFKNVLETETNYKMLVNGSSVSLAKMPKLQKDLLSTQIANNIATHTLLASQKKLTDEQKNELVKLQEKFDNEINLLVEQKKLTEYQAKEIRYADWKQLMQDGEFMAAVIAKSDEQQKMIMQQAGQFANAVVNARTGGKIAKSLGGSPRAGSGAGNYEKTTHQESWTDKRGHSHNKNTETMLNRSIPSWQETEW